MQMFLVMLAGIATASVAGDVMPATMDGIEVALELPRSENNPRNSEGDFIQLRDAFL